MKRSCGRPRRAPRRATLARSWRALFAIVLSAAACVGCAMLLDFDAYDTSLAPVVQRSDGGEIEDSSASDAAAAIVDFAAQAIGVARVVAGSSVDVTLAIARAPGFDGLVTVDALESPGEVLVALTPIGAGKSATTIRVSASAAAPQGRLLDVRLALRAGAITRLATLRVYVTGRPGTPDMSFGDGGVTFFDRDSRLPRVMHLSASDAGAEVVMTWASDQSVWTNQSAWTYPELAAVDVDGKVLRRAALDPPAWRVRSARTSEDGVTIAGEVVDADGTAVRIARYGSDGGLDPTFGDAGALVYRDRVPTNLGNSDWPRLPLAANGDGGTLLALGACATGSQCAPNDAKVLHLIALDRAGGLDPGYAGAGTLEVAPIGEVVWMIRLLDGKILASDSAKLAIVDEASGTATDFGPSAIRPGTLAQGAGGRIFFGHYAGPGGLTARLTDGGVDFSFGNAGTVVIPSAYSAFANIRVDGQGRVLLAARGLFRIMPAGTLDFGFGFGGVADGTVQWNVLALTNDARVYVAGQLGYRIVVGRYWL